MDGKINLWNRFCENHGVLVEGVPLFECKGLRVDLIPYGHNRRPVLKRSEKMGALVVNEVEKVLADLDQRGNLYYGLIYIMFWKQDDRVIPLYIRKSEKCGKHRKNLSGSIRNIRANPGKFCRWGYNYAYLIGDLSAVVCEGHPKEMVSLKYQRWAERLFKDYPTSSPELKKPVYFWISAWKRGDVGPLSEDAISLAGVQYDLVWLANKTFPSILLNEGKKESQYQYNDEISDFTKALEINPKDALAYNNRGRAYISEFEYHQAILDFDKALEINPKLSEAYYNRAAAYYRKKEYDKSWEDIKKAQDLGCQVHDEFLEALCKASGRQN